MKTLIAPTFNFLLLVGGLAYLLKDKIPVFIRERKTLLERELLQAQSRLEEALQQQKSLTQKMGSLGNEVQALHNEFVKQGEKHRESILNHAQRLVKNIREDAVLSSKTIAQDFRNEVTMQFVDQVIARTEKILKDRMDTQAKMKLNREFSTQLEVVRS